MASKQTVSFYVLFSLTSLILLIIWTISIQQFCVTNLTQKYRINRTFIIAFFCTCCIMLNTLRYLSVIYPNVIIAFNLNCVAASDIFEALIIVTGFHIFKIFNLTTIDRLYAPINQQRPKWIDFTYLGIEIFVIAMVLVCYIMEYIYTEMSWIGVFYIILAIVVFGQSLIILLTLTKILRILSGVRSQNQKIYQAKRAMKVCKM